MLSWSFYVLFSFAFLHLAVYRYIICVRNPFEQTKEVGKLLAVFTEGSSEVPLTKSWLVSELSARLFVYLTAFSFILLSFAFSFASGICSTSTPRSPLSTDDSATGICQACQAEAPAVLDSSTVLNVRVKPFAYLCILLNPFGLSFWSFWSFCFWLFLHVGLKISNLISSCTEIDHFRDNFFANCWMFFATSVFVDSKRRWRVEVLWSSLPSYNLSH